MDSIANFFNGLTNYDNLGFLGDLGQMWPLLFMVILFYFILYRPQKRQQKRRQEMFSNLNTVIPVFFKDLFTVSTKAARYAVLPTLELPSMTITRSSC